VARSAALARFGIHSAKPALDFVLDASTWAILLIIAAIFYAIAIARFSKAR
jgi:hypothetical protein